jgi:hypothetical protein
LNERKKELLFGTIFTVVVVFLLIPLPFTRASVPDDVENKLHNRLITKIERSWWHQKIECEVNCGSADSMYTVIDSLTQQTVDSLGYIWESAGIFYASLIPEEIFTIARTEEVIYITDNPTLTYYG